MKITFAAAVTTKLVNKNKIVYRKSDSSLDGMHWREEMVSRTFVWNLPIPKMCKGRAKEPQSRILSVNFSATDSIKGKKLCFWLVNVFGSGPSVNF